MSRVHEAKNEDLTPGPLTFAVAHDDYQPEYRTFQGWKTSTAGITSFDDLPQAAKDYIRFIEDETETRAAIISTGLPREETILR